MNILRNQKKIVPLHHIFYGEMGEWFIPAVLKTAVLRGTGGSNPSLSATIGCLTNCQAAYSVDYKF